eukprot:768580-Hanusia_phi.AAC.2
MCRGTCKVANKEIDQCNSLSVLVKGNMSGDEDEPTIINKLVFFGFSTAIEVRDKEEHQRLSLTKLTGIFQGRKRTLEEQKAAC